MRAIMFLLFFVACSTTVFSDQRISTIIHGGTQWANPDGTGFAIEMFYRLMKIANLNNSIDIYPVHRARAIFSDGRADCYFSGSEYYYENILTKGEMDVIASTPFTSDGVYAFSLKSNQQYKNFQELRKLKIASGLSEGFLKGLLPEGFLDEASYIYMRSDEPIDEMLNRGRIDTYIGFKGAFQNDRLKRLHYDENFPLYTTTDSLVCINNSVNKHFVDQVSSAIEQGLATGALDDLYETYNRDKPNN